MGWKVGYAITTMILCTSQFDLLPSTRANTGASTTSTVQLLFADEFNGSSLNLKKWYRCYPDTDENVGCSNNTGLELDWEHVKCPHCGRTLR
jgi:hypothetical protein